MGRGTLVALKFVALRKSTLKAHASRTKMRALALLAAGCLAGAAHADPAGISVELNKLEPLEKGCRAYVVVTNNTETAYQALKLDLVLFQPDGVISRRYAIDLAPVKAGKRSVKLFDIDTVSCEGIGSFLINDVVDCKSETGPLDNCLANLSVSSLNKVQLTK
jgi:hypothetical protein